MGTKHTEETKALLSERTRRWFQENPEMRAVRGTTMRAARVTEVLRICPWCTEVFISYSNVNKVCEGCRPIDRLDKKLRGYYNITFYEFQELFLKQNGLCQICGMKPTRTKSHSLSIDHCHQTSKVRGLLCESCNLVLGKMQDSPTLLRKAAAYLETHIQGE